MAPVKSLAFGLVVLGSVCTQANAAGTRWWAWSRAWKAPDNDASSNLDSTPTPAPFALPYAPPAYQPAPSVPVASYENTLLAGQGYWTPLTQVWYPSALTPAPYSLAPSENSRGVGDLGGSNVASVSNTATFSYSTVATPPPTASYDAFVDFGSGPYASENMLTTGGAQSWYESPTVEKVFGGVPNGDQARVLPARSFSGLSGRLRRVGSAMSP